MTGYIVADQLAQLTDKIEQVKDLLADGKLYTEFRLVQVEIVALITERDQLIEAGVFDGHVDWNHAGKRPAMKLRHKTDMYTGKRAVEYIGVKKSRQDDALKRIERNDRLYVVDQELLKKKMRMSRVYSLLMNVYDALEVTEQMRLEL